MRIRRTSREVLLSRCLREKEPLTSALSAGCAQGDVFVAIWPQDSTREQAMEWQAKVRADAEKQKGLVLPARNVPLSSPVMAGERFILQRGDIAGLRAAMASCPSGGTISVRWVENLEAQAEGPSPSSAKLPAGSAPLLRVGVKFPDGNSEVPEPRAASCNQQEASQII